MPSGQMYGAESPPNDGMAEIRRYNPVVWREIVVIATLAEPNGENTVISLNNSSTPTLTGQVTHSGDMFVRTRTMSCSNPLSTDFMRARYFQGHARLVLPPYSKA